MDINHHSDRERYLIENEDATSTCARLVHEEVTGYYAAPEVADDPPLPISRHWTTWEAYRRAPDEHHAPAVPVGEFR